MTANAKPVFLSVAQIAEHMGVGKMTVYRLIDTKELKAYRFSKSLRVNQDDFIAYLRNAVV